MEDPLFKNRWNPVRRFYFTQSKPSPSKPKVVSIPVHFVGSDDHSKKQAAAAAAAGAVGAGPREDHRLAAAVKIQKVFRGFVVRKSVRTVRRLASEAEEIARRIEADEKEIRRDAKGRLRVGEMLMSLLLRLDSVRGIRENRKKVIRRVISLQEAVDSISVSDGTPPGRSLEAPESMEMPQHSKIDAVEDSEILEIGDRIPLLPDISDQAIKAEKESDPMKEAPNSSPLRSSIAAETKGNVEELILSADSMEESAVEAVKNEDECGGKNPMNQETLETSESTADASGMKEVIERVVEDNERLKVLVAELCEGNAKQCRLMSRLVERVEQLEQSVHRMERKKKKKKYSCGHKQ